MRLKRLINKLRRLDYDVMDGSHVDNNTTIGSYTYIGFNCLVTKAKIGRYCSIANNVSIGPGEHDLNRISTNSIFYENPYEELTKADVTIGHDVWIGANVVIRRGVKIGNGAAIGANSFVNCDVPEYAVFAGTPAKLIKFRFDQKKIDEINATKWWDQTPTEAKKIFEKLK